jgi:hypothetical protein
MTMRKIRKFILFLWESQTFTTWGAMFSRLGGLVFIIPLVLTRLPAGETAIWFLFTNIITLGYLADFGFSTSFLRLSAFAMGGATNLADFRETSKTSQLNHPNWAIMEKLYGNVGLVYLITSVFVFFALIIGGSLALHNPISNVHSDSSRLWISWLVVCVGVSVSFYGRKYDSLLKGMNYVSLVNRYNILFSILGTLSLAIVIMTTGDILYMVICNQAWNIINMFRNRYLLMSIENRCFRSFPVISYDKEIFQAAWAPSWRQAILIAFSGGVSEASGIIYAQFADVNKLASYLLALKFINFIAEFSQAPFYSKIPTFSKMRAQAAINDLKIAAGTAMKRSLILFTVTALIVGFGSDFIFLIIKSKTSFVPTVFWLTMVVTWYLERHHAMHAQIYCTTNHIPFYVPVAFSGTFSLLLTFYLVGKIGFWAFPISKLVSNAVVNNWWNVKISLKSIDERFFPFFKEYVACSTVILLLTIFLFLLKNIICG